jgi:hypothetical protein
MKKGNKKAVKNNKSENLFDLARSISNQSISENDSLLEGHFDRIVEDITNGIKGESLKGHQEYMFWLTTYAEEHIPDFRDLRGPGQYNLMQNLEKHFETLGFRTFRISGSLRIYWFWDQQ